jgi:uncharacterized protein with HXXEE motif
MPAAFRGAACSSRRPWPEVRLNATANRTDGGSARRFGAAWVGLCAALAVHVADEASTGFLDVYNPSVEAIRARLPWLPLPTFTFEVWLGLLVLAVAVLLALSVFAFRGVRWLCYFARFFAAVMFANGVGHVAGSIFLGRAMPGVYSSPLLFAGSVWLWTTARRAGVESLASCRPK